MIFESICVYVFDFMRRVVLRVNCSTNAEYVIHNENKKYSYSAFALDDATGHVGAS